MSVTSSKEWFNKGTMEGFSSAHEPCRRPSHLYVSSLLFSRLTDVPVGHDCLIAPYSAKHLLDLLRVITDNFTQWFFKYCRCSQINNKINVVHYTYMCDTVRTS